MKTARTISLGVGIVFLLGIGAATLSPAQQTGVKAVTPARVRSELRERILTLRTEIDLLQLDIEVDRAVLLELLKQARQVEQPESVNSMMMMENLILQYLSEAAIAEAQKGPMSEAGGKKLFAKAKDELRKGIERNKKGFAERARLLNEKELELEDTEAKYRTVPKD